MFPFLGTLLYLFWEQSHYTVVLYLVWLGFAQQITTYDFRLTTLEEIMINSATNNNAPINRWWLYQKERFPLINHGLLIIAFSLSGLCFSALIRGSNTWPSALTMIVAMASSFLFFLQLRIADEFKDFADDLKYRPYRPVPRGLIQLRELGIIGGIGMALQAILALWLEPMLLWLLLLVWAYGALMSYEFFVPNWLKARPIFYMLSHMFIMPLIDLYVTACDWLMADGVPHSGLSWFLLLSFLNGLVVEIGRKIRTPAQEETGVETYSKLWGNRAALIWWAILGTAGLCGLFTATQVGFVLPVAVLMVVLLAYALYIVNTFRREPTAQHSKQIELISGLWTILIYLCLGPLPLLIRLYI